MATNDLSHRLAAKISSSKLRTGSGNSASLSVAATRRVSVLRGTKHKPSLEDYIMKRRALDTTGHELDSIREDGFFFRPSDTLPDPFVSSPCDGDESTDHQTPSPGESPTSSRRHHRQHKAGDDGHKASADRPTRQSQFDALREEQEIAMAAPMWHNDHRLYAVPLVTAATALHSHPVQSSGHEQAAMRTQSRKSRPSFLALRSTSRSPPPPALEEIVPPSPPIKTPGSTRISTSQHSYSSASTANCSRNTTPLSSPMYGPAGATVARKASPTQLESSDASPPNSHEEPALTPAAARSRMINATTSPSAPLSPKQLVQHLYDISNMDYSTLRESADAVRRKRNRTTLCRGLASDYQGTQKRNELVQPLTRDQSQHTTRPRTGYRRSGLRAFNGSSDTHSISRAHIGCRSSPSLLLDTTARKHSDGDLKFRSYSVSDVFDSSIDAETKGCIETIGEDRPTPTCVESNQHHPQSQSPAYNIASSMDTTVTKAACNEVLEVQESDSDEAPPVLPWWRQGPPASRSAARTGPVLETIKGGDTPCVSPMSGFSKFPNRRTFGTEGAELGEAVAVTMEHVGAGHVREITVR